MACKRGKASPDKKTQIRLYCESGGYCQKPDCHGPLFFEVGTEHFNLIEIAHIIPASNRGPRKDDKFTEDERGQFENLILLCPTCHTMVDKADDHFPAEKLREWKAKHSQLIADTFTVPIYQTRDQARQAIESFLIENRTIWQEYGPENTQNEDPESELPSLWRSKIFNSIIPNNRKLYSLVQHNYVLLRDDEKLEFEKFKQHVDDFEKKHLHGHDSSGMRFPGKFQNVYL